MTNTLAIIVVLILVAVFCVLINIGAAYFGIEDNNGHFTVWTLAMAFADTAMVLMGWKATWKIFLLVLAAGIVIIIHSELDLGGSYPPQKENKHDDWFEKQMQQELRDSRKFTMSDLKDMSRSDYNNLSYKQKENVADTIWRNTGDSDFNAYTSGYNDMQDDVDDYYRGRH